VLIASHVIVKRSRDLWATIPDSAISLRPMPDYVISEYSGAGIASYVILKV